MVDVVGIGEILIDLIAQESVPINEAVTFKRFPGGAPANVLVGISRLGLSVGMITRVGNDFFGRYLLSVLKREKIDTKCVKIDEIYKTGLAWVGLNEDKKPSFSFYRSPCADINLQKSDIDKEYITTAKVLHYGTVSMAEEPARSSIFHAISIAHENGVVVTCDPNFREDLWRTESPYTYLNKVIPKTDILKISIEDSEGLTNEFDEESLYSLINKGPKIILVTQGAEGATAYTKDEKITVKSYNVNTVDTTGAGDAFMAGFIFAYLYNYKLYECISFANKVASISTTKMGAMSALPTLDEIKGFNFKG